MQWSIVYSVGVKQIDEEHKQLFRLISEVGKALDNKVPELEILKTMVEYAKKHFASEEMLMKKIHYPRINYHIQLHKQFEQQIIKYLTQLKQGKNIDLLDLKQFLEEWLINHILKEDKKIGEYRYSK